MYRRIATLVILLTLAALSLTTTALAQSVYTSFEEFAPGTTGPTLGVPGVTFDSGTVQNGGFSWNGPGDVNVLDGWNITMTFDEPQQDVSFIWAACVNSIWVEASLGGNLVSTQSLGGTQPAGFTAWEGTAYLPGPVDEVRVSSECVAIDHLAAGAPGCPVLINIPSTAVGGAFVSDAETYWAPGHKTNPIVTITEGNTAWVIGQDATGAYYKIIWECQYLWVPVGTMGPNFDEVWNGTPLPTDVVE